MTPVSAATRVLALLGDPVSHSRSPRFQNAAIRALGLDGVYLALRCSPADLPGLLLGLARAGGGGNVTVPHKELAAQTVQRPTEAVRRTGACNTFWYEDGAVCGDNTDVVGFARAAHALLGGSPAGARVLVLGAGGAARAAVAALLADGADRVVLVNRTEGRARELLGAFDDAAPRLSFAPGPESLAAERFDLVVNATSLGLRPGDPLPLDPERGVLFSAALDLVYAAGGTPWVQALASRGVRAADGTEMLLHQGAAAFQRWWGVSPPFEAMRAALT